MYIHKFRMALLTYGKISFSNDAKDMNSNIFDTIICQ